MLICINSSKTIFSKAKALISILSHHSYAQKHEKPLFLAGGNKNSFINYLCYINQISYVSKKLMQKMVHFEFNFISNNCCANPTKQYKQKDNLPTTAARKMELAWQKLAERKTRHGYIANVAKQCKYFDICISEQSKITMFVCSASDFRKWGKMYIKLSCLLW